MTDRFIIALTGASGVIYGVRALELLQKYTKVETHLIISKGARLTLRYELNISASDVADLSDCVHSEHDLGSPLSSGSFKTMGMFVAPCSIKTLSAVANSYSDNLVARAADVILKERRRLVLLLRETPLHSGHIRLMDAAAAAGAIIYPPVPAFYARPVTVDDIIDQTVGRALDLFDLELGVVRRWTGDHDAPVERIVESGM